VELDRLENTFSLIGVSPAEEKISLEELQKIEDYESSRQIIERIQLIYAILQPSLSVEAIQSTETSSVEEGLEQKQGSGAGIAWPSTTKNEEGAEAAGQETEPRPPDESPKQAPSLKISELDPQAKLYLQSLSIITIISSK
jgi:hypothetical protein